MFLFAIYSIVWALNIEHIEFLPIEFIHIFMSASLNQFVEWAMKTTLEQ